MCRLTHVFQILQVNLRLAKLLLLLLAARPSSTWLMTSDGSCIQSRRSFGFCKMLLAAQNRLMMAIGSVDRSELCILLMFARLVPTK